MNTKEPTRSLKEAAMSAPLFSVVYRQGGTERCRWNQVAERYTTRADAQAAAASIERQGYKALVFDAAKLESIGLPEGWSASWEWGAASA